MTRLRIRIVSSAVVLLVGLLTSCVQDEANRYYGDHTYSPRPADEVEVLYSEPGRPYTVIADFQSRGDTERGLRDKAAKIGADAVIIIRLGGIRSESDEWAGQDTYASTYSRIVGTAIKYN